MKNVTIFLIIAMMLVVHQVCCDTRHRNEDEGRRYQYPRPTGRSPGGRWFGEEHGWQYQRDGGYWYHPETAWRWQPDSGWREYTRERYNR